MECKLTDKNMDKMLVDGQIDSDLGIVLPGANKSSGVKEEENEDIQKVKDMLADIKSA